MKLFEKALSLLIAIACVFNAFAFFTYAIKIGDVNQDNNITAVDARLVLQVVAGLKKESDIDKSCSDVNGDDKISAVDARMILRIVAGLDKEIDSPEWKSDLTDGYWENKIQTHLLYDFHENGTGKIYCVAGMTTVDISKVTSENIETFTWQTDNDYLIINNSIKLKYVSKSDNYDWDMGVYHNLPEDEMFFYETEYICDDSPSSNAFYLSRYNENHSNTILSFEEARIIAEKHWNIYNTDGVNENGTELAVFGTENDAIERNGVIYYHFRLRAYIDNSHWTTWDEVYVNSATGECVYSLV